MGCARQYCPACGEELIHRDQRKGWESSSSFGAIFRREGPLEITMGDVDAYIYKATYRILRVIEHKQPDSKLGRQQLLALAKLGQCIQAGITQGVVDGRSGVYVMRGKLIGSDHGRREVNFDGRQSIYSLDDELIYKPSTRDELWGWINGDGIWTPRNGRARIEFL